MAVRLALKQCLEDELEIPLAEEVPPPPLDVEAESDLKEL